MLWRIVGDMEAHDYIGKEPGTMPLTRWQKIYTRNPKKVSMNIAELESLSHRKKKKNEGQS